MGGEEMKWEEAKEKWYRRLLETTSGQDIPMHDITLIDNLIQAADEEIAKKDKLLDVMVEVNQEKEKEITRLREALGEAYKELSNCTPYLAGEDCTDHFQALINISAALKENSDEL